MEDHQLVMSTACHQLLLIVPTTAGTNQILSTLHARASTMNEMVRVVERVAAMIPVIPQQQQGTVAPGCGWQS